MSFTFNEDYIAYQNAHGLLSQIGERRRVTVHYIDINSKFRNKKDKTIVNSKIHLINDPLIFTQNSNIICIKHKNHKLKIDDIITIDGVCNKCIVLASFLNFTTPSFEINCNFMKIFYKHQIPLDNTNNINVTISGIQGDVGSYLGNIPITSINTIHQVFLTLTASQIMCDMSMFPANYFEPNPDYFFILLPQNMQTAGYTLNRFNYKIQFDSIAGIPVSEINTKCISCHVIKQVSDNDFCIEVTTKANITEMAGGNNIVIGVISYDGFIQGYPLPNQYLFFLPNCLNNVIATRLVCFDMPKLCKTVMPEYNKLIWQDIDSGNYEALLQPGNYTKLELLNLIKTSMESINRSSVNGNYTLKHYVQTSKVGDKYCFELFKCAILIQPITNVINTGPGQFTLTITHPNHNITTNTNIIIQNAISTSGIDASIINQSHNIMIIDANSYSFSLSGVNLNADLSITNGGNNVTIYVPDQFRFIESDNNIISNIFSINKCGSCEDAVCDCIIPEKEFSHKQCYEKKCGNRCSDIFLLIRELPTFFNSSEVQSIYAKIKSTKDKKCCIYDIYHIYKDPIHKIDRLYIEFVDVCGKLVNICDHSFIIEVITLNDIPEGSMIFTNTGKNYDIPI